MSDIVSIEERICLRVKDHVNTRLIVLDPYKKINPSCTGIESWFKVEVNWALLGEGGFFVSIARPGEPDILLTEPSTGDKYRLELKADLRKNSARNPRFGAKQYVRPELIGCLFLGYWPNQLHDQIRNRLESNGDCRVISLHQLCDPTLWIGIVRAYGDQA